MDEYVKKSSVIDWFRPYGHMDEPIPFETLVSDLRCSIPTADVEPVVHGRWEIVRDDCISRSVKCTACSEIFYYAKRGQLYIDKMPRCPKCGAKLDGGAR